MAPRPEQVVVLAGGLATRLGRMTADIPKILLPVQGRAFLDLMLESVAASGLRRFHFCLGHLGDRVTDHLGSLATGWEFTSCVEPESLGTAGALLHSVSHLDKAFLLMMGDTYLQLDYGGLFDVFPASALGMMVLTRAECGVPPNVQLRHGMVVAYDKRGIADGWIDTGVTVLRRQALALISSVRRPLDLALLFQSLIDYRALAGMTTEEGFFDIGTPARYQMLLTRPGISSPDGR